MSRVCVLTLFGTNDRIRRRRDRHEENEVFFMITIEEAGVMLDEIADSLPQEFFRDLNGGIILFPEEKVHPRSVANDLYILGEYHHEKVLGRYIIIYFGSFLRVYHYLEGDRAKEKLRATLVHEFTHHLESLAGERGLEIQDEIGMQDYLQKQAIHIAPPTIE